MHGYGDSSATSSSLGETLNDSKYEHSFNLDTCQNDDTWSFMDDSSEKVQLYDLDSKHSMGMLSIDMGLLQLYNNPENQTVLMEVNPEISCQTKKVTSKVKRKLRRKKIEEDVAVSDNAVQEFCKRVHGSGKYIRCPKSWEFLMRLLVNSETNPEVICWEDESQYIFRLVQPNKIVELWNAKGGKSSGNYDNFARSLR
ncbi:unnamed protein product, partial [Meganyctiphanes norvegica]